MTNIIQNGKSVNSQKNSKREYDGLQNGQKKSYEICRTSGLLRSKIWWTPYLFKLDMSWGPSNCRFEVHRISDLDLFVSIKFPMWTILVSIKCRTWIILECIKFPIWSFVGSTILLFWSNHLIIHQISDLNNFWGSSNFCVDPWPDFYHFGVNRISDLKHSRLLNLSILNVEE